MLNKYLLRGIPRSPEGDAGAGAPPAVVPTPPVGAAAPAPSLAGGEPPKAPEGEKPAEGAKPPEAAKPPAAPAAIDAAKFKLPEGFKADEKTLGSFATILSDDKMEGQAKGQALLDLYAAQVKQVADGNTKAWTDMQDQWVKDVKADKEIGGDKLEPTRQVIAKAVDGLGPELAKGFREAMDSTGAGNHPAVVKALAKFATQLTEGGHITGKPPGSSQDLATMFYPNSPEFQQKG